MKKQYSIIFAFIFILILNISTYVFAEVEVPPEINAEAGLLLDMKTGSIIYSKNADKQLYPASTTKILTAILVLEKGNLSDVVTASSSAIAPITLRDSHMGILVGEQLTLEQLLNGMLIYSANDAANVMAVHLAGSIDAFAEMMNEKAKEIGAVNSHFVNPHGFHDDQHYTTANDLAVITRYAMSNDKFREIVSTPRYNIAPTNKYKDERILSTTNHLISRIRNTNHFYAPAIGIKTGFTNEAKNCLVAAAKKDNTEFLSVVLKSDNINATTGAYSFTDTIALFEYGFKNYAYQTVASNGEIITDSKVKGAKDGVRVALTVQEDIVALLPANIDKANDIKVDIKLDEKIQAPILKGDVLGTVSYTYKDEVLGKTNIVGINDVERDYVLFVFNIIISIFTSPFLYAPIVLIGIGIIILRIRSKKKRRNRRSKLSYPKSPRR